MSCIRLRVEPPPQSVSSAESTEMEVLELEIIQHVWTHLLALGGPQNHTLYEHQAKASSSRTGEFATDSHIQCAISDRLC